RRGLGVEGLHHHFSHAHFRRSQMTARRAIAATATFEASMLIHRADAHPARAAARLREECEAATNLDAEPVKSNRVQARGAVAASVPPGALKPRSRRSTETGAAART